MIISDIFEPKRIKDIADKVDDIKLDMLVVGSEKKYCIERKEVFDLVGSMKEGRLWNQLERLKKLQETDGYLPRLIIEGNKFKLFTFKKIKFAKPQYTGLINSILDYGVPIIYTDNVDETILTLKNLDKRSGDATKFIRPTIQKGSGRKIFEEQQDILSAISGIGNKSAAKLLENFGTVENVFNSSESEIALLIGVDKAKHMKEILKIVYNGD